MEDTEQNEIFNEETFNNENENVPCFVNTEFSNQIYALYSKNGASCTGKWCSKVLSDMNVEKKRLNKLCYMTGQSNSAFKHIKECIICVRYNTSNFIHMWNIDPLTAIRESKTKSLVFDLKNKIGGYEESHMVCFSEKNFHLGSKHNKYTLSLDCRQIDDEQESIYNDHLN